MIVPTLHQIVGQGSAIGPHVADRHVVGRPIGLTESGDEIAHRTSLAIVHEDAGVGLSLVTKLFQLTDKQANGLIPGYALPRASLSPQRSCDAIRIVEDLQPGQSLRAERALIVGMKGVAFDLDRSSIHDPDRDPAVGGAKLAHTADSFLSLWRRQLHLPSTTQCLGNEVFQAKLVHTGRYGARSQYFEETAPAEFLHNSTVPPFVVVTIVASFKPQPISK